MFYSEKVCSGFGSAGDNRITSTCELPLANPGMSGLIVGQLVSYKKRTPKGRAWMAAESKWGRQRTVDTEATQHH